MPRLVSILLLVWLVLFCAGNRAMAIPSLVQKTASGVFAPTAPDYSGENENQKPETHQVTRLDSAQTVSGAPYMRARYYSPQLMRFVNADPIGFAGGMNWYAYAGGDPMSNADPTGNEPQSGSVTGSWLAGYNALNPTGERYLEPNGGRVVPLIRADRDPVNALNVALIVAPVGLAANVAGRLGMSLFGLGMAANGDTTGLLLTLPGSSTLENGKSLTNRSITELTISLKGAPRDALGQLFGNGASGATKSLEALRAGGSIPQGLTREALQTYREIAVRQIARGADTNGAQAIRLQVIEEALKRL